MEALGDKLSSIIIDHDYQLYICLSQISDLWGENAFKRLSLHCIMIVMNKKKKIILSLPRWFSWYWVLILTNMGSLTQPHWVNSSHKYTIFFFFYGRNVVDTWIVSGPVLSANVLKQGWFFKLWVNKVLCIRCQE